MAGVCQHHLVAEIRHVQPSAIDPVFLTANGESPLVHVADSKLGLWHRRM